MDLYINTRGSYLHIKDEMFEIRIPSEEKSKDYTRHHFAAHKVRTIIMHRAAALSTDAVMLALQFNIDILFVEYDGHPAGRVWHSKHGSTTKIRKKQLEASLNQLATEFVKKWIATKLNRQIDLLKNLAKHREPARETILENIEYIEGFRLKLLDLEADNIQTVDGTIRGWEGSAGRAYFGTLSQLMPKRYEFNGRSFRPAKDAFNAILNYAYGILYGKVEKALIIAGIDPFVGFLHRDDYNQKSMVFDFIEPFRPWVDEVAFKLFSGKHVNDSFFAEITNGVKLTDEGKPILIQAYNKFFEDTPIRYKNKNQSRHNIIQFEAHSFANSLITKI